jgi:hypothetical protein
MSATSAVGKRSVVDERGLRVTSVFTKRGEHAVLDHVADADEEVLVALGYKQEFKRYGNFLSSTPLELTGEATSRGSSLSPFLSPFWVCCHRLLQLCRLIWHTRVKLGPYGDGLLQVSPFKLSLSVWRSSVLVCQLQVDYTTLPLCLRLRDGARLRPG